MPSLPILSLPSKDAAKIFGSTEQPPGLVLPDQTSGTNRVIYEAIPGVHGTDRFGYVFTDCLDYGEESFITINLDIPDQAFFK